MTLSWLCGGKPYFSGASFAAVALVMCATFSGAQVLHPPAHPNHYIILLDRSGSTVQAPRKENYAQALRETLPSILFGQGTGNGIPPYDPKHDVLTVERFGIVEGDIEKNPSLVREKLPHADFLTEYIHVQTTLAANVKREELQRIILSDGPHYRFTLLSWCKELGIWSLSNAMRGRSYGRTFLIVVDDGLTNGADGQHEVLEAMRLNPQATARAREIVEKISAAYKFVPLSTSMAGGEAVFPISVGSGLGQVFIENYEVVPQGMAAVEKEAAQLKPFDALRGQWAGGRADNINLHGNLNPEFVRWLTSHGSGETKVAIQNDSAPVDLRSNQFSVTTGLPRSCGSASALPMRLSAALSLPDATLGARSLEFTYTQSFSPPMPPECTVTWAVEWGATGIVGLCLGVILSAFLYLRYLRAPMTVRLPGHRSWTLKRHGQMHLVDTVSPRLGSPLFEFGLSPLWARRVLCRGAKLRLLAEGPAASDCTSQWPDGGDCLDLGRYRGDKAIAYRTINSGQQHCSTKAVFEHGRQRAILTFTYSGGKHSMLEDHNSESQPPQTEAGRRENPAPTQPTKGSGDPIYYVALDLGSESMAAYYTVVNSEGKRDSIRLQYYAPRLVRDGVPWLFTENGETSNRLRTRFDLRSETDDQLQDSLDFICGGSPDISKSEKSVFQFFHKPGQPILNPIPNPKIVFERGAQDAIPDLGGKRCLPEQLIHWLTEQVVINFVLQSPPLKDVPASSIVLILTVPNVYSVTHVESLRSSVQKYSQVREVRTVFESDAVAAYAMSDSGSTEFHRRLKEAKKRGPVELVTFDMGRGTTDLSIVQFEGGGQRDRKDANTNEQRWLHYQKARTGRSDGGNKLTHVFVEYFEKTVDAAYQEVQEKRPYSFVQLRGELLSNELRWALESLEQYIQELKTRLSDGYSFSGAEYNAVLKARDILVENLLAQFQSSQTSDVEIQALIKNKLKDCLTQALTLRPKLRLGFFQRRFGHWFQTKNPLRRAIGKAQRELITDLERYTEDNVTALIHDLRIMADQYEVEANQTDSSVASAARDLDRKSIPRFAVVAGQAAHFRPVEKAIREAFNELEIDEDAIYFVPGAQAKECCCQGAAAFYANYIDAVNEDHLHGTFAIIEDFEGMDPISIPVQQLQNGPWTTNLPRNTLYRLCFSPKPYSRVAISGISDDNWTVLYKFQDNHVEMTYDRAARSLSINQKPVKLQPYGIRTEKEFYARLWPERLLPASARVKTDAGGADRS